MGWYGKTRHDSNPEEPKMTVTFGRCSEIHCSQHQGWWSIYSWLTALFDNSLQVLILSSDMSFKSAQLPVLMSQDTFLASVTAEASMPRMSTAMQAVHCTIPSSTIHLDYKSNGVPWSVQCGRLAESWFPSVVHGPSPRILSCPLSFTTSLSFAFRYCSPFQ